MSEACTTPEFLFAVTLVVAENMAKNQVCSQLLSENALPELSIASFDRDMFDRWETERNNKKKKKKKNRCFKHGKRGKNTHTQAQTINKSGCEESRQ